MAWTHPTGKVPESVTLVAMGPSKAEWVQDRIHMNPTVETEEIWTLNAGTDWVAGADLVFYMDDLLEQVRHFPGTETKLRKTKVPIITTQAYPHLELQAPVYEYPLQDVLDFVGPANAYFVNSVPYIIAYAMMLQPLGLKRLLMFGVDYNYPGVRQVESGRPNCEFWVGTARQAGLIIQVPGSSTLLNANQPRQFYGYLRQPLFLSTEEAEKRKATERPLSEVVNVSTEHAPPLPVGRSDVVDLPHDAGLLEVLDQVEQQGVKPDGG